MAHAGPVNRAHCTSLPARLAELQLAGRLTGPPLFTSVPPSCQAPVQSLVDADGDLKSVVLLGFTRDGGHLVSYTTQPVAAADGVEGYALQLWTYRQGAPCQKLWSVPLFRTQRYLDSLEDEEDFLASADDKFLTVAESPDSSLLVVHGRSADPADAASRDSQLANFLTIIPGPLHAGAAQLQVVHLAYHTSFPHATFNPFHSLALLDGSPGARSSHGSVSSACQGCTLAVALYTGAGVRFVHMTASRQEAQPLPASPLARQQSSGDDENSSSASRFPSPESAAAAPHASFFAASPAGQRTPAQPPAFSLDSPQGQQQQQQQQQRGGSISRVPSSLPQRSPPQRLSRHLRLQPHRAQQERSVGSLSSAAGDEELEVETALVPCAHAYGGSRSGSTQFWQQHQRLSSDITGSSGAMAAVGLTAAPLQLDLESCIFDALRQQGVPPAALADYAAAPVQAGEWEGQDGLLLLAVLRLMREAAPVADQGYVKPAAAATTTCTQAEKLAQQAPHRSTCALLHAAAADGAARLVEWLEPPYPWHDDLSAFLVQQTAFAGLAFEKAPAFFADFLARCYGSGPLPRGRRPLVLTNRSVLGSGSSLSHIVHPWLPQAVLGWGGARM